MSLPNAYIGSAPLDHVLLIPVAQFHAPTGGRTCDSHPGCENFLYMIKKGAGLRAAPGAVLDRHPCSVEGPTRQRPTYSLY